MQPMKPMKPMQPMKPMEPMAETPPWWPDDLGKPSSTGGQGGMRYAFFPEARRLAIERNGAVTLYDSADHHITGVSQDGGDEEAPAFRAGDEPVRLSELRRLE